MKREREIEIDFTKLACAIVEAGKSKIRKVAGRLEAQGRLTLQCEWEGSFWQKSLFFSLFLLRERSVFFIKAFN